MPYGETYIRHILYPYRNLSIGLCNWHASSRNLHPDLNILTGIPSDLWILLNRRILLIRTRLSRPIVLFVFPVSLGGFIAIVRKLSVSMESFMLKRIRTYL